MPEERKTPEAEPAAAPPPAVVEEEMDEAMQSLSTALRFSFMLLKVIMVILLAMYFASGFYLVDSGQVALEMRFGKITGVGEDRIKKPGSWRCAFPAPIGEVVYISTQPREIEINTFWPTVSELDREEELEKQDKAKREGRTRVYRDAEDAYLMTGDVVERKAQGAKAGPEAAGPAPNLVQLRFTVQYLVKPGNAERHFLALKDAENTVRDIEKGPRSGKLKYAENEVVLMRGCAEAATVRVVARHKIYDVLKGRVDIGGQVKVELQKSLDSIESGVTVGNVSLKEPKPPKSVAAAFRAVNSADQEFRTQINNAKGYANKILAETAGERVGETLKDALLALWREQAIDLREGFERARRVKAGKALERTDAEKAARRARMALLQQRIDALYRDPKTGEFLARGEVRNTINRAEADARRIVERTSGAAKRLADLLKRYENHPRGEEKLLNHIRQLRIEAVAALLARAQEKFYIGRKAAQKREVRIQIGRDPEALKQRKKVKQTR